MLARTALFRRVPSRFRISTSSAVVGDSSAMLGSDGSRIEGGNSGGTSVWCEEAAIESARLVLQSTPRRRQDDEGHRVGPVVRSEDIADRADVTLEEPRCGEGFGGKRRKPGKIEVPVQRRRLGRDRAVCVERPQCPPGPRKGARDRCQVAPNQVDHVDPQHQADVGKDRRDFAGCAGLGDGRDRIAASRSEPP